MGALTELPPELVVGWALWVIGGLLLTAWFLRRSSARKREVTPQLPHGGTARLSGTRAVAGRNPSGTHVATGQSSGSGAAAPKAPSAAHPPDAFAELRALLDEPEDPPRS